MAMGQNLSYHIWVDEHPFTSYFDVHQGYRVLTHNQMIMRIVIVITIIIVIIVTIIILVIIIVIIKNNSNDKK